MKTTVQALFLIPLMLVISSFKSPMQNYGPWVAPLCDKGLDQQEPTYDETISWIYEKVEKYAKGRKIKGGMIRVGEWEFDYQLIDFVIKDCNIEMQYNLYGQPSSPGEIAVTVKAIVPISEIRSCNHHIKGGDYRPFVVTYLRRFTGIGTDNINVEIEGNYTTGIVSIGGGEKREFKLRASYAESVIPFYMEYLEDDIYNRFEKAIFYLKKFCKTEKPKEKF